MKIAFVIPWYGDDIRGGAESECNHLAHCLSRAGVDVEVLTTCVKQASDDRGKNTLSPGMHVEGGICVRRFRVKEQNLDKYHAANYKLYHGQAFTIEDEKDYFSEDINSPEMYEFIEKNCDEYDWFIFLPYLYGVVYNGMKSCPGKCILMPCLHDEPYAYMKLVKEEIEMAKGVIFLSQPEADLAFQLFDIKKEKAAVLGAYVESGWENDCDAQRFRKKYKITSDYLLYAGRKDPGKKADMLISYFARYRDENPQSDLKLVLIGGGSLDIPQKYSTEIIDLGFVSVEDKHDAMAAAFCLCNPSFFESFSIVIMESWLAKRPVLVSEQCKVTTNFCLENNGGLYFDSYGLFKATVSYLLEHRDVSDQMGQNGFEYVQKNFVEESIKNKYLSFLTSL